MGFVWSLFFTQDVEEAAVSGGLFRTLLLRDKGRPTVLTLDRDMHEHTARSRLIAKSVEDNRATAVAFTQNSQLSQTQLHCNTRAHPKPHVCTHTTLHRHHTHGRTHTTQTPQRRPLLCLTSSSSSLCGSLASWIFLTVLRIRFEYSPWHSWSQANFLVELILCFHTYRFLNASCK